MGLGWLLLSGMLNAAPPPAITTQPADTNVLVGATASFSVSASSLTTMSYQWYFGASAIGGATHSTYTLNNAQPANAGGYSVAIHNDSGTVTSRTAILTVSYPPPILTRQPTNEIVPFGGAATFTVSANSGLPLSYQWYFQSSPIAGATASSYTVANAQYARSGAYSVAVMNASGSVNSTNATLTVTVARGNTSSAVTPTGPTGSNAVSWSHTVNNGTNRVLLVGISSYGNDPALGVTYGGTPLTFVGAREEASSMVRVELFCLVVPPVGTNTITVTLSGPTTAVCGAADFFGVDPVAPLGSFFAADAKNPTPSLVVASTPGELIMDVVADRGSISSITPGPGQTQHWNAATGNGATDVRGTASTKAATSASTTMSWTTGGSQNWALGAVPLNPIGGCGVFVWDGGGTNNYLGTANNWLANVSPINNGSARLHFTGSARPAPIVNTNWGVAGISFSNNAAAFTFSGSPLCPRDYGINNSSTNVQTFSNAVTVAVAQTWNAASGGLQFRGSITNNSNLTIDGAANVSINNPVSGSGNLTKAGLGTLTLSGSNTYSGGTFVNAGRLLLTNATLGGSGPVTVASAACLGGYGTIKGLLTLSGSLQPGNPIGSLTTKDQTWNGGASLLLDMDRAGGTQGLSPGWSSLNVTGPLTVNAAVGNPVVIKLTSFDLSGQPGPVTDFNALSNYTWTIATASGGISGFASNKFVVDASAFANPLAGGSFRLAVNDNSLSLVFVNAGAPTDVATALTGPTSSLAGNNFTCTISVANLGLSPATAVVVSELVPPGLQFVSASGNGSLSNGVVTWPALPALAGGAATNYTITCLGTTNGYFTNIVSSTASTGDPNQSNTDGTSVAARWTTLIYSRAQLTGQRLPTGGFQIQFSTVPNQTYWIQASTNLTDWQTILITNPSTASVIFTDSDFTNYPARFYRGNLPLP